MTVAAKVIGSVMLRQPHASRPKYASSWSFRTTPWTNRWCPPATADAIHQGMESAASTIQPGIDTRRFSPAIPCVVMTSTSTMASGTKPAAPLASEPMPMRP